MRNQAKREYWDGYRKAQADVAYGGIEYARRQLGYGCAGPANSAHNACGYRAYLSRLEKRKG